MAESKEAVGKEIGKGRDGLISWRKEKQVGFGILSRRVSVRGITFLLSDKQRKDG